MRRTVAVESECGVMVLSENEWMGCDVMLLILSSAAFDRRDGTAASLCRAVMEETECRVNVR